MFRRRKQRETKRKDDLNIPVFDIEKVHEKMSWSL
jgi:hypothetical protein